MPHKERSIRILAVYDPDLVKFVKKSTKPFKDSVTGELIPKGSNYFVLPLRAGRNLVNATVSVETYEKLVYEGE